MENITESTNKNNTQESLSKYVKKANKEFTEELLLAWKRDEFHNKSNNLIKKNFNKKQQKLLWSLEDAYNHAVLTDEYDALYDELLKVIKFWSEYYYCTCYNLRLDYGDFFEVMINAAVDTTNKYSSNSDFSLFQTLQLVLKNRGIDLIRKAKANKRAIWHKAARLPDNFDTTYADDFNLENAVVQKILLEKIFKDPSLTEEERKLLKLMYDDPNITLDELANRMEWGYREKVRRTLKRIRMKLQKYNPYD